MQATQGTTLLFCAVLLGAGCQARLPIDPVRAAPGLEEQAPERPDGAPEDSCWHRDVSPAVIETETRQVIVQPAQLDSDGRVIAPAVWRTERAPRIVRERQEQWIETPCPDMLTPDFVRSLQRALAARGYYRGTPSGEMDRATARAIARYQSDRGTDSDVLSLASARALGLVVIDLSATN